MASRRFQLLRDAAVVAAVTASLVASGTSIYVDRHTRQDKLIDSQQAKREVVNQTFLDAANDYGVAVQDAADMFAKCDSQHMSPCTISADLRLVRSKYQAALNAMYVYASARALKAARAVSATLPPSVNGEPLSTVSDPKAFASAYSDFIKAECLDARQLDRDVCNAP